MVKDKPNSIRTYDEDGFRKRAACLCVKNELEDEVSFVAPNSSPESDWRNSRLMTNCFVSCSPDSTRHIEWQPREMDSAWRRPGTE